MQKMLAFAVLISLSGLSINAAEQGRMRNLSGKWVLKTDKSEAGNPEVTTMIIEHEGNVIRWTATISGSGGTRVAQSYQGAIDGNPYPVLHNGTKMAEIAYTAIDRNTIRSVSMLPNAKKSAVTHTLSEDGKTLTNTSENGSISVWHKR
jgi:hypothetical protein